jgi:eukaryotic-like serine/threonine-protein kinase
MKVPKYDWRSSPRRDCNFSVSAPFSAGRGRDGARRRRTREPVESPHTLVQTPGPRDASAQEPTRRRLTRRGDAPGAEDVVLGRYRLLERLGTGGFGVVWRAHDQLLHREVAVKRVSLGAGGGPIDSERAEREALAAARLSHPAIVALHEACAVDEAFYLISELVDGETLARLIAERALADEEVLAIGLALASALSHAHARGVVHRDIKPQNVLVPYRTEDGGPAPEALVAAAKLTDFGGASLAGEDALTRTGDVLGTLAYMAPEQSEGRDVGAQADLYSLALVIYEALCGVNPVRGPTPAATVRRIGRPLQPLQRRRRDLPIALTRALDRALAREPAGRGTLEDLRLAFEEALEHGLRRPRWRRGRAGAHRLAVEAPSATMRRAGAAPAPAPLRPRPAALHYAPAPRRSADADPTIAEPEQGTRPRRIVGLPRAMWLACAAAAIAWQAFAGRPGLALLIFAALLPLLVLPGEPTSTRLGAGWLACALAPVLGLAGLAGAFPAIAGQASRWRDRAALAALGYWWLALAEPLLGRRLWLGPPSGTPARPVWEGSLSLAATHVIAPLLVLGMLLGALLWGAGAAALPWIVRGRSAVLDVIAVTLWSAAIAATAPALDAGLAAHATQPNPRGAVLGAILGGVIAVAARALRGPV